MKYTLLFSIAVCSLLADEVASGPVAGYFVSGKEVRSIQGLVSSNRAGDPLLTSVGQIWAAATGPRAAEWTDDSSLRLIDLATGSARNLESGKPALVAWNAAGTFVAAYSEEAGEIRVWDSSGTLAWSSQSNGSIAKFALDDSGRRLLALSQDGTVRLLADGKDALTLHQSTNIARLAFANSGDGAALIADAEQRQILMISEAASRTIAMPGEPQSAALSKSSKYLFVTLPNEHTLLIENLEDGSRTMLDLPQDANFETMTRLPGEESFLLSAPRTGQPGWIFTFRNGAGSASFIPGLEEGRSN